MDQKLKAKWIAALRSGKFNQSTLGSLRDEEGYCCMGVLTSLIPELKVKQIDETTYRYHHIDDPEDGHYGILPKVILDRIGLSSSIQDRLISMNDLEKMSFFRIANWIDQNDDI